MTKMVVVSKILTTGEVTFLFRATTQILSFGGLFLLGYIVLGNAPRVATIETHDMLNRVVGESTARMSSLQWLVKRIRRKSAEPKSSSRLTISLLLLLFFSLFVSLSDIGFIGFHACTVPKPSYLDFPASVRTDADALRIIKANLVPGVDPVWVNTHWCDVVAGGNCTVWRNSTYADPRAFRELNTTDSNVLMPRLLSSFPFFSDPAFDLNTFYRNVGARRVTRPVLANGLAIVPHGEGLRVVVGVPQLSAQQEVVVPKTLALEVDVGCINLGVSDITDGFSEPVHSFTTDDRWIDSYIGPNYLADALIQTARKFREAVRPLFGDYNINNTVFDDTYVWNEPSWSANIASFTFPNISSFGLGTKLGNSTLNACSSAVNVRVGLPPKVGAAIPSSCMFLQLRGAYAPEGKLVAGLSRMVCAAVAYVNMVSATVAVDAAGSVSLDLVRLPSTLHVSNVSYPERETTVKRYTLADPDPKNGTSMPTMHPIVQQPFNGGPGLRPDFDTGPGVGASVFSTISSRMLQVLPDEGALATLVEDFNSPAFTTFNASSGPAEAVRWAGEMGASYILASVGYIGWAAQGSPPLTVRSTGGHPATCFTARYGAAFLPLWCASIVVMVWAAAMLASSKLSKARFMQDFYGGIAPRVNSAVPKKSMLERREDPRLHLEIIEDERQDDVRGALLSQEKEEGGK
ncbi:hypothetical protein FPV67DRAFT_1450103 [Lyophyllum atratum]|nr:hypothetical protein FPV67DRAFT_1450103 [Lyophyllum atratum]